MIGGRTDGRGCPGRADPARKGYLIINENEAAIVRLAFDLYERIASDTRVARELNKRGYRTKGYESRRGRVKGSLPWSVNSVTNLLTNPTYAGIKEINRKNRSRAQESLSESARYRTVPGVWPPIIDREQSERVRRLRAANARTKHNVAAPVQHNFVLQGVLKCDYCGTELEGSSGTSQNGTRVFYYRHSKRAPKNCPLWRSIPADQIERLVLDRLGYLAGHIEIIEEVVAAATANLQQEVPEVLRRLRERQDRLAELRRMAEGTMTLATAMPEDQRREFLEPRLAKIRDELRAVEGEVALLERSRDELKGNAVSAVNLQSALQVFETLFREMEPHKQRELLGYLVEDARMSREFLTIRLYGKASADEIGVQRDGAHPAGARFAPTQEWLPKRAGLRTATRLGAIPECPAAQGLVITGRKPGLHEREWRRSKTRRA